MFQLLSVLLSFSLYTFFFFLSVGCPARENEEREILQHCCFQYGCGLFVDYWYFVLFYFYVLHTVTHWHYPIYRKLIYWFSIILRNSFYLKIYTLLLFIQKTCIESWSQPIYPYLPLPPLEGNWLNYEEYMSLYEWKPMSLSCISQIQAECIKKSFHYFEELAALKHRDLFSYYLDTVCFVFIVSLLCWN